MRDLQQMKQKRAFKPHSITFMSTPIFAPRRIETGQCGNRLALWGFQCTRGKLLSILRRHDRIDSILKDVKHRIAPMHFLLSTAEAKIKLNVPAPKQTQAEVQLWADCMPFCARIRHEPQLVARLRIKLQPQLNKLRQWDLLGEQSFRQHPMQAAVQSAIDLPTQLSEGQAAQRRTDSVEPEFCRSPHLYADS